MTNRTTLAIGALAMMLGAAPISAQTEVKPAGTMTTQTHSAAVNTKTHTVSHTTTKPRHHRVLHHRVAHHRVVRHRRHHAPAHMMKKTTVETHTTADPK